MMTGEITEVSQCRVGLAPTLLEFRLCQAATGTVGVLVPWAARIGSHACPLVMTACKWRRIVAAITAWA